MSPAKDWIYLLTNHHSNMNQEERKRILVILKKAKKDYTEAYNTGVVPFNLNLGLCFYLDSHPENIKKTILKELFLDRSSQYKHGFWYSIYGSSKELTQTILPRLNNINKTIKRLEKSLKNE